MLHLRRMNIDPTRFPCGVPGAILSEASFVLYMEHEIPTSKKFHDKEEMRIGLEGTEEFADEWIVRP